MLERNCLRAHKSATQLHLTMKKFQLRTIFISHNAIGSHEQGRSNGFSIGNANGITVVHLTQRLCLSHVKIKTNEAAGQKFRVNKSTEVASFSSKGGWRRASL